MKLGKLSNEVLHDLIIRNIGRKREEVLIGTGIGEDNAIIDFEDSLCVVSTDPITGATKDLGKLAVHISCNDVAASGAEPIAVLITILAPKNSSLEEIEEIMNDASEVAGDLNVEIIGGHTEITDAVNRMLVSTTVLGKLNKDRLGDRSSIESGFSVLMTKTAAIEGSSILAKERERKLSKNLSLEEINKAKNLDRFLSVVKEGQIAAKIGANYMHDITEGGVLGGIWEASKAINKGIKIYEDLIPFERVSLDICNILGLDPLKLISSGSLIIIIDPNLEGELGESLEKEGISLTKIGEVIDQGVKLVKEDGEIDIDSPSADELYKIQE